MAKGQRSDPVTDGFIAQVINLLGPFVHNFEFRYIEVGFKQLLTLADVYSAVADLLTAVKLLCVATLTAKSPSGTGGLSHSEDSLIG